MKEAKLEKSDLLLEQERRDAVAQAALQFALEALKRLLVHGVCEATVYRDLSIFPNEKIENPDRIQRTDGKTYPARQRTEAERQELVARLRQRGLSLRRIAELLGVDTKTVYNDLNSGLENSKPETPSESTGADGKTYPARQRTAPNAMSWPSARRRFGAKALRFRRSPSRWRSAACVVWLQRHRTACGLALATRPPSLPLRRRRAWP